LGVKKQANEPSPYPFDAGFQRLVAAALAQRATLYGTIGHALEIGRFTDPAAKFTLRATQAVAADLGSGPSSWIIVAQRLRRWMDDGTVTFEELGMFEELITEYKKHEHVTDNELLTELLPVVKRLQHWETSLMAIEAAKSKGGFTEIQERIRDTEALGKIDRTLGTQLNTEAVEEIYAQHTAERLTTGIHELDLGLNGGLARGKLGLFCAGKSGGKSMFLVNQARACLERGQYVAFASVELPEYEQNCRLLANLAGWPIDKVKDPQYERDLQKEIDRLNKSVGHIRVKWFKPKVTNFDDIAAWIRDIEMMDKRKIDVVVLDYIDKLGSSNRKHDTEYLMQGQAAEDMRIYCVTRGIWGWTASQPKRRDSKQRKQRIEAEDVADSMNKVRAVDLMVSASRPTEHEIEFFVAANNHGPCGFGVAPLPQDFLCGRIVARADGSVP
jgi:hypothetical protein